MVSALPCASFPDLATRSSNAAGLPLATALDKSCLSNVISASSERSWPSSTAIFTLPRNTQRLFSKSKRLDLRVPWPTSAEIDMLPCVIRTLRNTTLSNEPSADCASSTMPCGGCGVAACRPGAASSTASHIRPRLLMLKSPIDLRVQMQGAFLQIRLQTVGRQRVRAEFDAHVFRGGYDRLGDVVTQRLSVNY